MEAYAHGLDEGCFLGCQCACRDNLLPGEDDVLAHGSVALHSEGLIVLAGVDASVAARGAVAAIGVGVAGDDHAWAEVGGYVGSYGFDDGTYLMAGDDRIESHGVATHEGVDV